MVSRSLSAAALLLAAAGCLTPGSAHVIPSNKTIYQGWNYGSTFDNNTAMYQADFEAYFLNAKNLVGGNGSFTSARLYTMIQAGTQYDPIEAIPAAIATNTTLLLGMWASAGQTQFQNELAALNVAIEKYGQPFLDLVVAISVGSEDLYRITPTGIENMSGAGASPSDLVEYISETRGVLANNGLANNVSVGHVDTWTAWVNNSNAAVIDACDFIGYDGYPYFQSSTDNSIQQGYYEFWDSYNMTVAAVQARGGSQPVWVTETGWPVSGPQENAAFASVANADYYWHAVGCELFGNISTWWFTMDDSDPDVPSPSFGIVGATLQTQPLFNITCPRY